MRVIRCPNCQEPLPGTARYCANCGESLYEEGQSPVSDENQTIPDDKLSDRPVAFKIPRFYAMRTAEHVGTERKIATLVTPEQNGSTRGNGVYVPVQKSDTQQEYSHDYEMQRRTNWNRVVTHKTPRVPSMPVTPVTPVTPGPTMPSVPPPPKWAPPEEPRPVPTRLFSWISILALVGLLVGGVFGIVVSLGRGILPQPSHTPGIPSLQVTPSPVAFGEFITLRGSNFSPSGLVGLTRDANIAIVDTGGTSHIHADTKGSFSDTVVVDPKWGGGTHIIRAEDAKLHKSASFQVMVTGKSTSLRPAHLRFSADAIDLGSGDQTTNSTKVITLSNAGGGQITWQATVTQSWLMISPKGGTFSSDQQVTIAGDRSNLNVGPYPGSVIFTSDTGPQFNLPVKMYVTPLQPEHEAVLQLTPAVLSFTGTDGAISPPGQVITVSNPGVRPLQWGTSTSTNDGSSWLSVSPQSGTVTSGNSQAVTVSVNISALLPGFYSGWVTFANQGSEAIVGSPQTIYMSLTIVPQCTLQVSPGALTFTGVYLQPAPAPEVVSVGGNQGCSSPMDWSASVTTYSGGHWLGITSASGVTPAYPAVDVSVTGLSAGTYVGAVVFSWSNGTQTLPVTFIMGQPITPIISTIPPVLSFSGIIGQPNPPPQKATITNTGGGTLNWGASAATAVGGAWLTVTPAKGSLSANKSASITVTAKLLPTLTAGTYNGTITITGTDGSNNAAAGSPQTISVSFVVQAPCTITATPPALIFQGVIGQPDPAAQVATIGASGACANALSWTAATTPAGSTWLTTAPATGPVGPTTPATTSVSVALAGLIAGTYSGTVTITAIDSVTQKPVGTPQTITVTLTVQPSCTLQNPPVPAETFSTAVSSNPPAQNFTIGVIGSCVGTVKITPTVTMGNGTGWLAVSPASAKVASGSSATFTVTVTSAALAAGTYTGSISLAAVDKGVAITGSPQTVAVTLNVLAPPALTTGPGPLTFNVSTGANSQPVTIGNTGGGSLNWTAALPANAPNFVSLSGASGTLVGGASTTISVDVNATGLTGGSTYTTSVTISAIDPITGKTVAGSPSTVSVTINVLPPKMTLSANALAFTTTAGNNPAAQTITIQNTGGDTLSWVVGTPSATWLTVTPASGSDASQASSPVTFNVNVAGLTKGPYTATVVITPTPGTAVTVTVTLTVN